MIPPKLYKQIAASMPITSVEAMIVRGGALLLMKRKNSPAKGEWWFPGGMVRKGDTFEGALLREVKEETGLDVDVVRFVGVYNRIFPERHDITIVYLCRCKDQKSKVVMDSEHSEYRFFRELPERLRPYLLETIRDSGWK